MSTACTHGNKKEKSDHEFIPDFVDRTNSVRSYLFSRSSIRSYPKLKLHLILLDREFSKKYKSIAQGQA